MPVVSLANIVGPTMIGPSSSHTAGAIRIGNIAGKLFEKTPKRVEFTIYNSFAKTGKGHGTDKALVGGVLGFSVDDIRIRDSFEEAKKRNLTFSFETKTKSSRHPNSVDITLFDDDSSLFISGNSIGAGEIKIFRINEFDVDINGDLPTLVMVYEDQPGVIWKVTKYIQDVGINIDTLNSSRIEDSNQASMSISLDSVLDQAVIDKITKIENMVMVRNIPAIEK